MKKLFSVLLILIVTICLINVNNNQTKADGNDVINISDVSELKTFLESNDAKEGKLTGSSYTITNTIFVNGTKELDLNGKTIIASSSFSDESGTMFVVNVDAKLKINANGTTGGGIVDGNNVARLFKVDYKVDENETIHYGELYIINGTYQNGLATSGGFVLNKGKLVIGDENIETNKPKILNNNGEGNNPDLGGTGGAIYSDYSLDVQRAYFKGNHAYRGGTIEIEGDTKKYVNIKNSEFIGGYDGSSASFGAAIESYGFFLDYDVAINIKDCSFNGIKGITIISIVNGGEGVIENVDIENCGPKTNGSMRGIVDFYSSPNKVLELKNVMIDIVNKSENTVAISSYGGKVKFSGPVTLKNFLAEPIYGWAYPEDNYPTLFEFSNNLTITRFGEKERGYDRKYYQEDIYISQGKIEVKDGFNTNRKLALFKNTFLEKTTGATLNDLTVENKTSTHIDLNSYFSPVDGNTYFKNDSNNNLNVINIDVVQYPTADNNFEIKTDIRTDAPVEESFHWFKKEITHYEKITEPKQYKKVNVTAVDGVYDSNKEVWSIDPGASEPYKIAMFKISAKANQEILFDIECENPDAELQYNLSKTKSTDGYIVANNYNKTGAMVRVYEDGDYYLIVRAFDKNTFDLCPVKIRNIELVETGESIEMKGETSSKLQHPEANCLIHWRVYNKNKYDSSLTGFLVSQTDLLFGAILDDSNKQVVEPGSQTDITFRIDADETDYDYFDAEGKVYLDSLDSVPLTKNIDYEYEKGSIIIKIKSHIIENLGLGEHSIYVKKSDVAGKEYAVATLLVQNTPTPSPDPQPKDESCEKVIGPTWHWNNIKGVCEEVGVVGTSTR